MVQTVFEPFSVAIKLLCPKIWAAAEATVLSKVPGADPALLADSLGGLIKQVFIQASCCVLAQTT